MLGMLKLKKGDSSITNSFNEIVNNLKVAESANDIEAIKCYIDIFDMSSSC
jgi:hypothetical protein